MVNLTPVHGSLNRYLIQQSAISSEFSATARVRRVWDSVGGSVNALAMMMMMIMNVNTMTHRSSRRAAACPVSCTSAGNSFNIPTTPSAATRQLTTGNSRRHRPGVVLSLLEHLYSPRMVADNKRYKQTDNVLVNQKSCDLTNLTKMCNSEMHRTALLIYNGQFRCRNGSFTNVLSTSLLTKNI